MAKLTLTDIAAGYVLVATYNANNALLEAALENTLSRDGTTPNTMSADLDLNSNRVTNLSDGTNNQDAVTIKQLNDASIVASTITAAATTLADAAGNYAATTVEAALAELFTGDFDCVGAWTFQDAAGIVILDGGGTDSITINHDGTDGNLTLLNAVNLNISGLSGAVIIDAALEIESNRALELQGATDGVWTRFTHTGAQVTTVTFATMSESFRFLDGAHVRIYDDGDTDYVELDHDGTDFNVTGFQTTDMNFSGMVGLNFASTNIGFYGTAPIAQQTGVAVSAGGIHAALVALGLITA